MDGPTISRADAVIDPGHELAAPPRLRLRHAIGWVLLAGVVAQLLGALVAGIARTLLTLVDPHAALEMTPVVLLPSMGASMLVLLAVALLAPRASGVPVRAALGLQTAPLGVFLAAGCGTIALGPTGDVLMSGMQALWPDATLGVVPMLNEIVQRTPVLLLWPFFALLPGICEELLFRGLLQRAAGAGVLAILLSAVAFSAFHVDPHHVIGVLPIGLFLAWVASRVGTLVTIFAHVVNNSVAIAAVHVQALHVGYGTDAPMPPSWAPIGLSLCLACAVVIARVGPRAPRLPAPPS